MATALDYAHRQGVVHRDIKPENILLQDGQALVADFGIALAVQQAGGSRMTQTGMSLGTPDYMSPEQAMGERDIGARSDVYALGAMTYEMLTGEPPFTGPNSQAIVAKVLTEQPPPIRPKRPSVPPAVEHAVLIALQKLPADRFGTREGLRRRPRGQGRHLRRDGRVPRVRAIRALRAFRAPCPSPPLALIAIAAGSAGWFVSNARRAPAPVLRYVMALPEDQALADTRGHRIAISPDGSRLVYVGHGPDGSQLWLRNRNQLRAAPIPGTNRATIPFFSPDGSRVGYVVEGNTEMRVVNLTGAPPIAVADSGLGADGATWSEDGFIYFDGLTGGGTTGLVRVSASGGKVLQQVTTVDTLKGERDHFWPHALPGGRGILFTIQKAGNDERNELAVLDTKTMKYHTLVQALTGRYSATGHLLYVTATGDLLAMPFSLDRLEVSGEPFAVTGSIKRRPFGSVDLALSMTGTLMYITGTGHPSPAKSCT